MLQEQDAVPKFILGKMLISAKHFLYKTWLCKWNVVVTTNQIFSSDVLKPIHSVISNIRKKVKMATSIIRLNTTGRN